MFGQASRGRESAGEAAVALHCRVGVGVWFCVELCGPFTPDPSPLFHGGEGSSVGQSGRTSEKKRIQLPCMMAAMSAGV